MSPPFPKFLLLLFPLLWAFSASAQEDKIVKSVLLNEIVINASLENFNAEDFMQQVKKDTTFYQAFLNMKYYPHFIKGAVVVFNKNESERGTMTRKAQQFLEGNKMWVEILEEETNGNIRKRNGDWKYITAEMYDEVFFPSSPEVTSRKIENFTQEEAGGTKMEKYKSQLKKFMFNPGAAIESVPMMGDKLAIFEDHMVPFYNYNIFMYNYKDSIPCVAFSCKAKEDSDMNDTVIKELTSYFHEETGEVMMREYHINYKNLLLDFDIKMKVQNEVVNGQLVPVLITYSGNWDIPFRKPEIISFQLNCNNYKIIDN